jgi:hypothetical protein
MTVKDLQQKLSKLDGDTKLAVYWEDGKVHQVFEIDEVSVTKGSTRRIDGKPRITFDSNGPETWVFVNISPA